jgi:GGDEF domain-containing protein
LINRKSSGGEVTVWCSASRLTDEAGAPIGYVAIQSDLTRLRQIQAENERLAQFDTLTGLPNRLRMVDRLEEVLQAAYRRGAHFAVICLDMDAFKSGNDTLGHQVGDALLVQIAEHINDLAARIGGDEFVVILPGLGMEPARKVAQRLLADLEQPLDLTGLPACGLDGVGGFPRPRRPSCCAMPTRPSMPPKPTASGWPSFAPAWAKRRCWICAMRCWGPSSGGNWCCTISPCSTSPING